MHRRIAQVLVLVSALALTVARAEVAAACEPPDAYQGLVTSAADESASTVTVPVTIHIMERPGRPCETRDVWSINTLKMFFAPAADDKRTVASVWAPTPIRFAVQGVEMHEFDPPSALTNPKREMLPPSPGPLGTKRWEAAFGVLMAKFHRITHVNVYLWPALADQAGFGRSPRSGKGKATVWLGGRCVDLGPPDCTRVIAHELGHALGLYHPGPEHCDTVQPEFQAICRTVTAPCGESSTSDRLMASSGEMFASQQPGTQLCPAEVTAAKEMATQLR